MDLLDLDCKVVIISFGSTAVTERWRQETKCPYPTYSDVGRNFYDAVGLASRASAVWNIHTMTYYAEQLAQDKPLPQKFENYEADLDQMGGDFLVSKTGKFQMVHCSKTPVDRPIPSTIIQILRQTSNPK